MLLYIRAASNLRLFTGSIEWPMEFQLSLVKAAGDFKRPAVGSSVFHVPKFRNFPASANLNFKLSVSPLMYAKKVITHSRIFGLLLTYVGALVAMRM